MSFCRRFHLFAVCVFVVGITMVAAGGTASAWVWIEADVHPVFRVLLPIVTLWLLFTMVRLAFQLTRLDDDAGVRPVDDWPDPLALLAAAPRLAPDNAVRALCPDAEFCQQVTLSADPEPVWRRRRFRARLVRRIGLPHDRHRYIIS